MEKGALAPFFLPDVSKVEWLAHRHN